MTTAYEVMVMSLNDAGVLAEGETPSADVAATAFNTLTQMLAMWQIDGLYVNAKVTNSFSPNGASSYTVGTGGTANFARPEKIDYAFYRLDSIDYPIRILATYEEYEAIPQKTLAGQPEYVFYNPTVTLGTLYVYPQPSTGAIHLVSTVRFPVLSTSADAITLPSEYIMPIRFNLSELLAAVFNTPIHAGVVMAAGRSRAALKRNNVRIPTLSANVLGRGHGNILAGP